MIYIEVSIVYESKSVVCSDFTQMKVPIKRKKSEWAIIICTLHLRFNTSSLAPMSFFFFFIFSPSKSIAWSYYSLNLSQKYFVSIYNHKIIKSYFVQSNQLWTTDMLNPKTIQSIVRVQYPDQIFIVSTDIYSVVYKNEQYLTGSKFQITCVQCPNTCFLIV